MMKTLFLVCGLVCALNASVALMPLTAENDVQPQTRYGASDFQGGTETDMVTQSFNYKTKTEDSYVNPYKAPTFSAYISNGCVVDAGGNALVYYDRLYDDLVTDYTHKYIFGKFIYGSQTEGADNMFADLASKMGVSSTGTTITGFKNGMTSYVKSKGHNVTLTQAKGSYYNTNIDYIKTQLKQEKVAVIFVDGFSLLTVDNISDKNTSCEITYHRYSGAHAMLIYGYADYRYYDASGKVVYQDTLFYVSSGITSAGLALTDICHYSTVDDVYIVSIT